MQTMHEADQAAERREMEGAMHDDTDRVLAEVRRLRQEVAGLRAELRGTAPDRAGLPTGHDPPQGR
jgi:hypothetical protein